MTYEQSCTLCEPGTYSQAGATLCTLCGAGTFQTGAGAVAVEACMLCPTGTYQTGSGMPADSNCTLCAAGTFQTGSGLNECVTCEAGKFQTGVVMESCATATASGAALPAQCSLNKTWPELVELMGAGMVWSGGLGKRAVPPHVLVWLCTDPSLAVCERGQPLPASANLACFTYHQQFAVFDWAGWNSRLRLVKII